MEKKFELLKHETEHQGAVLSLKPANFRVKEFFSNIKAIIGGGNVFVQIAESLKGSQGILSYEYQNLLNSEGVPCEILCPGKSDWQKGKVRVAVYLEFCPDEPEVSDDSLDGIRQAIDL